MKFRLPAIAAAFAACVACVEVNSGLGGSLIPIDQTYDIYVVKEDIPADAISVQMADSLSGYSQTRITIGAISDPEYGMTTRSSVLTIVPMHDTLDFGNPDALKFVRMHFAAAKDTTNAYDEDNEAILQGVHVYALEEPLNTSSQYDINSTVNVDRSKDLIKGAAVINGTDSLSFDFTEEYARNFMKITQEEVDDIDKYLARIPGIEIECDKPMSTGGRINMFQLQLGYDSSYEYVTGNYAMLNVLADYDYDGVAETDTCFFFGFGFNEKCDVDSLFENVSQGSYPEYALNLTTQDTRSKVGKITDRIMIEGGGGLKPVVSAVELKHLAEKIISEKGADPKKVVINKASLIFPFEKPADYKKFSWYPTYLTPTCRMRGDTLVAYAGLTDSSSDDENQGTINRSTLQYEPDITYHLQELLKINETPVSGETDNDKTRREYLLDGQYDIWFLIQADEVETSSSSSSSSSDLSEYYQYLAYQSYYNSMYGGYGGYSSYGYGGYGSSYSNYYTYMMMAQYASGSSSSSTSTTTKLDKDRFYRSWLYGPASTERRPVFELTFSVPKE